jgi:hypothetical protein
MKGSPYYHSVFQCNLHFYYGFIFVGFLLNFELSALAMPNYRIEQNCTQTQVEQYVSMFRNPWQQGEAMVGSIVKTCGPTAIPSLINALENEPDAGVRYTVAAALGFIGGDTPINPLMDALKNDRNPTVRRTAADALGTIRASSAVQLLLEKLEQSDEDIHVRKSAAVSLADIGDTSATIPLMNLLRNTSEPLDLRLVASQSLARIDESTDTLAAALRQDLDLRTQYWTVRALLEINSPHALNVLKTNQTKVNQILDDADQAGIIESYRLPPMAIRPGRQLARRPILCDFEWVNRYWNKCR